MSATNWVENVGNVGTGITLRVIYQDCQHSSIHPNIGTFRESRQRISAVANIRNATSRCC